MSVKVSALNLHLNVPWKDVRRMIMRKLNNVDILMVRIAHNSKLTGTLSRRYELCYIIAKYGHLELLKWARANSCPWDERTCSSAAGGGHLDILEWAHANGCPWNSSTYACAALNGHLAVLPWARNNGCPWGSTTCKYIAGIGQLDILKWARATQNNLGPCPWDETFCTYVASKGYLTMLEWAYANGCPFDKNNCRVWAKAFKQQHIIDWLDSLNNPTGDALA